MNLKLIKVEPSQAVEVWYTLGDLQKRLWSGTCTGDYATVEGVARWLNDGDTQLWVAYNEVLQVKGYALTEVMDGSFVTIYQGVTSPDIRMNGAEIQELILPIERWAKFIGCKFVHINGRVGWKRMLESYNFYTVTVRKKL